MWFDQKNQFFKGVVLVQVLWFKTGTRYGLETLQLCGKMIKTKGKNCWWKLAKNLFALPPPPILNRVKNESADSRSVKTMKKEKYRFHYFLACSVEVTCIATAIILESMFWNIKSAVFTYGIIGEEEFCCWACMFANAQH